MFSPSQVRLPLASRYLTFVIGRRTGSRERTAERDAQFEVAIYCLAGEEGPLAVKNRTVGTNLMDAVADSGRAESEIFHVQVIAAGTQRPSPVSIVIEPVWAEPMNVADLLDP
ncbi:MAG: hypothetical protein KatS3mg015_2583 [Fimbriimonadales bacterium]|nr:MAG: hypothetical protein KatS3mg015_2583 [Fimbriimonadales bacterium]